MKKTNASKLSLRTETIMPLTPTELSAVHGGFTPAVASSNACVAASIAAGRSSDRCAQKAGEGLAKGNDFVKKHAGFSF